MMAGGSHKSTQILKNEALERFARPLGHESVSEGLLGSVGSKFLEAVGRPGRFGAAFWNPLGSEGDPQITIVRIEST